MAVKYVEEVMYYGSPNKQLDIAHMEMWNRRPPVRLAEYRLRGRLSDPGWNDFDLDPRKNFYKLLSRVPDILELRTGNCQEQAILAAIYLITKKLQTGVAYISLYSDQGFVNFRHSFVLLGMAPEGFETRAFNAANPPAAWLNAVWCDPWAHDWFEVKVSWPVRVTDIMRMLQDAEPAMKGTIMLECLMYYDEQSS